jgi:AraC family transcriptional regulator of arabinose operon
MSGKTSLRSRGRSLVPEILAVGQDRAVKNGQEKPGRGGSDVFSVYLKGGPQYELDGIAYPASPPMAILIPSGTWDHDIQQGEVDGVFVLFHGHGLVSRRRPGFVTVAAASEAPPRVVPILRSISTATAIHLQDLIRRISAVSPMHQQGLFRRAAFLLEALALYCDETRGRHPGAVHRDAQRLRDLIDADPFQSVAMSQLYGELSISPAQAATLFARAFGLSPVAYRLQVRLNRARELLISTHLNVSETAYQVGFSDPLYFSRIFHDRFGVTPSSLIREFTPTRRRQENSMKSRIPRLVRRYSRS